MRKETSWIAKDIMDKTNTVSLSYVLQASFLLLERKNTAFLSVYIMNYKYALINSLKDPA